ncbi:DUF6252 family protein [Pontibacter lucknowensis]|uniref:Uncharacterized protein n=1 Tax=Pontibacter lucknowensis TaxID=1077936 RepID=A0A1N7BGS1_9BACT|nr:DUF6252 family protein [Pontibacter lucknowensis]SIR50436.1 hypothetical protein SAMN05421545_3960 [Pontibacter lucknowensis]
MKATVLPFLLLFTLLSIGSCKKRDVNPKDVLPAATMEGKNTFGAMVNDKVWLPKGRPSTFQPNLQLIYDPGYENGSFDIRAFRVDQNTSTYELMNINITQVNKAGIYDLGNRQLGRVYYEASECVYEGNEGEVKGTLEITKLDLQNDIIAGKFEFTIKSSDCKTISVTEGRFDKKIF